MHGTPIFINNQQKTLYKQTIQCKNIVQLIMKTQSHFLQESLIQQPSSHSPNNKSNQATNNGTNSFLQSMFFSHIYTFLSTAKKYGTNLQTVPSINEKEKIQPSFSRLKTLLQEDKPDGGHEQHNHGLLSVVFTVFKTDFLKIICLVMIVSSLKMYSPFLCAQIIEYIAQRKTRQYWQGLLFLGVVILVTFFKSLAEAQMNYRLSVFGTNLSSNLSLLIYDKSLRYPLLRQKQFSSSDIINYSQVDCERMTYFGNQLSSLLSTPLQLTIGIVIMWVYIGFAFLAGLLTTIIMIWITFFVSKYTVQYNSQLLNAKDNRMKATQQMLENIRFIKVNALQPYFLKKINRQRQQEQRLYKKKGWCQAFGYFLYWLTGPMILFVTFTTYILLGNEIASQAAFTTIMIFSLLQYPIRQLPTSISQVLQMLTSLKRIEKFLNSKEIKNRNIQIQQLPYEQISISISYGTFKWRSEGDQKNQNQKSYIKVLRNINLPVKRNRLTMIFGQIGSGKSSLLLAILNEMKAKKHATIKISGRIAYCSQNPWILSDNIRKNIILLNQFNEYKFKKVIYYSGLQNDMKLFPRGDLTQIGEKGMNISGGQKARISLARALYGDYDIFLLDDILSAVDTHMRQFFMKETIKVYLKEKTVVLVTHCLKYARLADQIVIMKKGNIALHDVSVNVISSREFKTLKRAQKDEGTTNIEQKINEQLKLTKLAVSAKQNQTFHEKSQKIIQELMLPEDQQTGEIKFQVFRKYIEYNGGLFKFALIVILAMMFWISATTFASIFMSMWCENPKQYNNGLIIYVSLSLSSSIFILIRASILILSGVRQGKTVHSLMINSLLKANLIKFYNRVPIGKIINRLTKDLRELDEAMGPAIGGFLVCLFQMLGTITVCIYTSTPFLLIPTVLLGYCCWKMKNYYLNAQREVARLQKITNTPIVNGFVSTLRGLESIRAYRLSEEFLKSQIKHINQNKRIRTLKQGLQSWFALNLTYLSFFVTIVAIGFCIFSEMTSPAIAGLLITYALNLSSDINLTILCYAYFETKVISLERIYQFTQIQPQERPNHQKIDHKIEGKISFVDTCVRYRQDLPNVLERLNIRINKGQKIGIAGRSGSGKTSIVNSLLRIAQISSGHLFIDGRLINEISVQKLRKSITIIDQQAIILNTSILENLDVYEEFSQSEIKAILQQCDMFDKVEKKGGLNGLITKDSLSSGEKQMICICRALLKKNPIILVDEASANIDQKNDSNIQQVLRRNFKESTVLTIAHRLETLSNSDKILILDDGKIVQFDTPSELKKSKGAYYTMLKQNTINI